MRFTRERDGFDSDAPFPHCDAQVLHAPAACEYCDRYPELQAARLERRVNFTGRAQEGFSECPAEAWRPLEVIERWYGNVPKPATA
jgi:hypothetical protein